MEGWIKLHRKILDNPIVFKDSDHLAVWIYLLINATHTEYDIMFNGKRTTLKPGQLITGRKSIAEKLHINQSKVQRILKLFKNEQQIEQQTTPRNRLITIVNWYEYQNSEHLIEQQVNNKRTTSEQQVNTNNNVNNEIMLNKGKNNIVVAFETNICSLTPFMAEKLFSYLDDIPEELILESIRIAAINNKKSLAYIEGILKQWINKGYKTLSDIAEEKKPREETTEERVKRLLGG